MRSLRRLRKSTPHTFTGLDLNGGNRPVVAFEDEVDLIAVMGAPVPSLRRDLHPADLLEISPTQKVSSR